MHITDDDDDNNDFDLSECPTGMESGRSKLAKRVKRAKIIRERNIAKNREKATTTELIGSIFSRAFQDVIKYDCEKGKKDGQEQDTGDIKEDKAAWEAAQRPVKDKNYSWNGEPIRTMGGRVFYKSATNAKGETISMGDFVLFKAPDGTCDMVCRILFMYQESFFRYFHGPCFMLSKNSPLDVVARKNELFYTEKCASAKVTDIISIVNVVWANPKETDSAAIDKLKCLYWRGKIKYTTESCKHPHFFFKKFIYCC